MLVRCRTAKVTSGTAASVLGALRTGGQADTSTTLVGHHCPRNRNELLSIFITFCPKSYLLRYVSGLGGDAGVASVVRFTGLTATAPRFGGIVTAWLGKTAREGDGRMALMGHAEEQCRHVTWAPSERSRDRRRR